MSLQQGRENCVVPSELHIICKWLLESTFSPECHIALDVRNESQAGLIAASSSDLCMRRPCGSTLVVLYEQIGIAFVLILLTT